MRKTRSSLPVFFGCIGLFFLSQSCLVKHKQPLIIWTNHTEFTSYIELFNTSHDNVKAIAVYKKNPAEAFPPKKGEAYPDIVIGPELKNKKVRSLFLPLDYLFTEQKVIADSFYGPLLAEGAVAGKPYLLPVSFNLPAVIFDAGRQNLLPNAHLISLNQLRETAAQFNVKNKGAFTAMGFAPSWQKDFLYLAAKLQGARFRDAKGRLEWDARSVDDSVRFLRAWTLSVNDTTRAEEDFAFKYLYTPPYRQVTSGKCLFAYITSDELFMIPAEQMEKIDFRWLHENLRLPVEESCLYMGVSKKSRNGPAAEFFVEWFFRPETQRAFLERTSAMRLNTCTFGIAGGFSALRDVTERVFPTFYPALLGNLPAADYIIAPEVLPAQWEDIKRSVIYPYLTAVCDTRNTPSAEKSIETLLSDWDKRLF
jgi:ABC-type glycerol-3-phosphate transport system substrate-binding protein